MNSIMGSISDNRKKIDRISNLPDDLITRILSLLSTEDAVRTSALSTYWNQKWTSVSNLVFDDGVLFRDDSGVKRNPNPKSKTSFVNFVYRVLLYKVTRLNYLRLQCGRDYGATNVGEWLSAALSRHVRMMDIAVPMRAVHLNNDQLFSSRTLVALTLGGFFLKVPEMVSLESLKTLYLGYLQFADGESISRLVSGCPVLEILNLDGKLGERVRLLNISSPSLKRLILKGLYSIDGFSEEDETNSYGIALDSPNLEYFEHVDYGLPYRFQTKTLRCLDSVRLRLKRSQYQLDGDNTLILAHSMANLVIAISNVRFLDLKLKALYPLVEALPNYQLPVFPRLTHLKIGCFKFKRDTDLLIGFLQCSPNLAYLSLKLDFWDLTEFYEPPDVPFCMLHNLKVIEVCCSGLEPAISMMTYFLENAMCLEELIIPEWKEDNAEVVKEIINLPTASKSCKIVSDRVLSYL